MEKCFYKIFYKYSQNIMNRLNFEMAAFCFVDECETGFHWSAWTSHHFFVQLSPRWLNDCTQWVKIWVITSWNITLQSRPDSKVHGINIRAWRCPHLLVPKPSWFGPASPHWQQRLKDRCVSWSVVPYEDCSFWKVSVSQEKAFFCNMFK